MKSVIFYKEFYKEIKLKMPKKHFICHIPHGPSDNQRVIFDTISPNFHSCSMKSVIFYKEFYKEIKLKMPKVVTVPRYTFTFVIGC